MQESKNLLDWTTISAKLNNEPISYKELNSTIRNAVNNKKQRRIKLVDVLGQRFIGAGLECSEDNPIEIEVNGTPGNDLGIFMDGPKITVKGNAEDQVGNTMNNGTIIVEGDCRDVAGFSMRGGRIFVKGNGGYRIGIHMKEYQSQIPSLILGGSGKEFFGEYMAGGILIALGLKFETSHIVNLERAASTNLGSGIHGGRIYIRGDIPDAFLGVGAIKARFSEEDMKLILPIITEFCKYFRIEADYILEKPFTKILPESHRPFAGYYTAKPI
ncbi:MAG: hypothetical protein LUQ65_12815 [Candidatus Helarchaeota archaeon]|nr:hypothetical protein [Candidatus Helarchaeota archaeon]